MKVSTDAMALLHNGLLLFQFFSEPEASEKKQSYQDNKEDTCKHSVSQEFLFFQLLLLQYIVFIEEFDLLVFRFSFVLNFQQGYLIIGLFIDRTIFVKSI